MRLGESLLSAVADSLSERIEAEGRKQRGKDGGVGGREMHSRCLWGNSEPKAHVPG